MHRNLSLWRVIKNCSSFSAKTELNEKGSFNREIKHSKNLHLSKFFASVHAIIIAPISVFFIYKFSRAIYEIFSTIFFNKSKNIVIPIEKFFRQLFYLTWNNNFSLHEKLLI